MMSNDKCCDNCGKCGSSHGMMTMDCCQEHKMSKEHLEMKKEMLEEKLEWVKGKLKEK